MMQIVQDSGYQGWVGVEYEGKKLDEYEGIKATKAYSKSALPNFPQDSRKNKQPQYRQTMRTCVKQAAHTRPW